MVGGVAVCYANMMAMPILNVSLSAGLSSTVNLLQLNNYNNFNLPVNLTRNIINNLLAGRLPSDAITVENVQRLIGRKYGTLIFNKNNIAILHKCEINRLIYPLCRYMKNTPEVTTGSVQPLMSPTNDGDKTNREEFNEHIQYMNDSPNNNFMLFTTGVYNQKLITYKHPYTLFVPPITPQYTSSKYANRK